MELTKESVRKYLQNLSSQERGSFLSEFSTQAENKSLSSSRLSRREILDKIKQELDINKKTAFDWRHKILSSLEEVDKDTFSGITESDEIFLLFSEKGKRTLSRKGQKRGGR